MSNRAGGFISESLPPSQDLEPSHGPGPIRIVPKSGPNGAKAAEMKHDSDLADGQVAPVSNIEFEFDHFGEGVIVKNATDLVTHVLRVRDDPQLSPWTFRALFLGAGLAIFASILQEIYYFKPQTVFVSVIFLGVVSYVLGVAMAWIMPRRGPIGRFLNPGPFNSKEHAFIIIMASAGATAAVATEVLAAQQLYYSMDPPTGAAIFLVISSQLLGYGFAGLLRPILVHPVNMLWPINVPISSLLELLHQKDGKIRLNLFYIIFGLTFIWEVVPEYMFPLLQGVSIFCLARRDSLVFTNLFGGSQGNEGLGFLSLCFDWQYVAAGGSPLWYPMKTLVSMLIGYLGCISLYMGIYYMNIWNAQDFPFLSQLLYNSTSAATSFVPYDIDLILTPEHEINKTALAREGIPHLTGSYVSFLITTSMALTATAVYTLLWNLDDFKGAFVFLKPSKMKQLKRASAWKFWNNGEPKSQWQRRVLDDPNIDPHYKLIVANDYDEVPDWWYLAILLLSFVVALVTLYAVKSTLPWWGLIVANIVAAVMTLLFGVQWAMTGVQFDQQPVVQMIAGYLHPGKPLANMYFSVFGYNCITQGIWLLRDLKLGQFAHLSPKSVFTAQCLGCIIGSIFNYIIMKMIVTNQRETLLSIQGTNIWSGANVQQYNTLAMAWSIADDLFSIGARYQWTTISYLIGFLVPIPFWLSYRWTKLEIFRFLNPAIIVYYLGWMFVGVNSLITSFFLLGFGAQWYLRSYHPGLFVKYNYVVSAALDGGTQLMVFILSFAVFGASGESAKFPTWAGNNGGAAVGKNIDYCKYNPALNG